MNRTAALSISAIVLAFAMAFAVSIQFAHAAITGSFTATQTVGNVTASTVPATSFSGGLNVVNGTIPATTFAGGVTTVTSSLPAVTFAGGANVINGTLPAVTFAGGVTGVSAAVTVSISDSLAASAADHEVTIDGVVIDLGTSALTANQVAAAIAAADFSGKNYTVTNPSAANLTFTKNATGVAGNVALTIQDASYTKTNQVVAAVTVTITGALAVSAADHSVTIDGVTIDLDTSAKTAAQVAAAIAANPFAGKDYTVTNPSGADLTFTKNAAGAAGNGSLTISDANYTTTNGVAASVTVTIADSLAASAIDHSISIDGVTIDLGTSALTAAQVAAAIAANGFAGKDYTVTNPSGADLTFTKNATGVAGNGSLTVGDAAYTKVNGTAATVTVTITGALAASATDHSVTIDGIVIDLGTSAKTAAQVASSIAAADFSGKNYTVGAVGADLTFTKNATGAAGNVALTLQDPNYTTTNGVAASVTITIPEGTDADETDHEVTIDGVVIELGTTAKTADQVAAIIAAADFSGKNYTVTNPSGADLTFTKNATGAAGNVALTIDAAYDSTGGTANVPAITFAGGVTLVTNSVPAVTFAGGVDDTNGAVPAITFAGGVTLVTGSVPAITFAGGVTLVNGSVPAVTFAGGVTAVAAAVTVTVADALAASAADHSVTVDGVTIDLGTSAKTAAQVAAAIAADPFTGKDYTVGAVGADLTFTKNATGAGGNGALTLQDVSYTKTNAVAASVTVAVSAALAASATDHSVTVDGVVIDLGTSAKTATQIAVAIAAADFSGKDYVVTNPSGANLTFTKNTGGVAGNVALTIGDADYTTTNGVAASVTVAITDTLAASAADHSITIDGVTIDLGTSAQTTAQIAAAIAANGFSGKDYTVTNPSGANLTFTKNATGASGNVALTISDASFTKTNAVVASVTITIPAGIVVNATDHSVTIDGITIDLGTSAQTAAQVAATIVANGFIGKDYTVTNPSGADLTFTKNTGGTAGNGSLTIQDASYGATAQVVTFTPAAVTSGETFFTTINGGSVHAYVVVGVHTVKDVVEALVTAMDAEVGVSCSEDDTKITCTADVAGTAFTYTATMGDTTAPVITLMGSATTSVALGNAYVEPGFSATDEVDGSVTPVVTGTVNINVEGTYTLTYTATDAANNSSSVTRDIVVSDSSLAVTPVVSGDTASGTLTNAQEDTTIINGLYFNVEMPANLTVTGPSTWDGTIELPTVGTPGGLATNAVVSSSIEIGLPNVELTFNKGVRLLFPNQAQKSIGWSRGGAFTEITATCASDSQTVGDGLAAGADCRIPVGSDLVVWTKHFTTFTAYSIPSSSGGGGGGGGGNGAPVAQSGGGGGGGGAVITTPVVTTPAPAPTPTPSQGSVLGATTFNFSTDMKVGSKGQSVTELQRVLIVSGFLKVEATGYFGAQTKAAVIAYQKAHGITPASGNVGPLTRASLNGSATASSSSGNQTLLVQLLQQLLGLQAKLEAAKAAGN